MPEKRPARYDMRLEAGGRREQEETTTHLDRDFALCCHVPRLSIVVVFWKSEASLALPPLLHLRVVLRRIGLATSLGEERIDAWTCAVIERCNFGAQGQTRQLPSSAPARPRDQPMSVTALSYRPFHSSTASHSRQ